MTADPHSAVNRTSRWDLPLTIQRADDAAQAAYCRKIAHRYAQAKSATLVILGPMNLYLWYDVLIGQADVVAGSFGRALLVLVPWLAATVTLWVSFHHRAQHFARLADHIMKSSTDGPQ
ncbi:MAG: hypothetical protein AB1428_13915, partial [Bacteroidota bacterium]